MHDGAALQTFLRPRLAVMSLRQELHALRALAGPVVMTQLLSMTLGVVDNVMLGHHSTEALASSSLGRTWVFGVAVIAMGMLSGLDPRVSQAHGARDGQRVAAALQGGVVLALLLSVPVVLATGATGSVLGWIGVTPELASDAGRYARAQLWGIPFMLLFHVQRSWLQGRGLMRPALLVVLAANALNAAANWVLIFGHLGFEAGGIEGAGRATALTQVFMCLALALLASRLGEGRGLSARWSSRSTTELRAIVGVGLPLAAQFGLEVWAFQGATLLAERLGTIPVAAHTIALNLASISFMVPLGISIGASTRVGNLIGEGRLERAELAARAAMGLGTGVMCVAAAVFIVGRQWLPGLYGAEPAVLAAATAILPIAAAFQLFDGLQVVCSGVLRGMGRTRILAVVHLVSFYGLGLPLAWWLAIEDGLGLPGVWWGLALGLGAVAVSLALWVLRNGPRSLQPHAA